MSLDEAQQLFQDVAFREENAEEGFAGLIRWPDGAQLRVCLHGATEGVRAAVKERLGDVEQLTGLRPRLTCRDPNLNYHFLKGADYIRTSIADTACEATYWFSRHDLSIRAARVLIRGDMVEYGQRQCVAEETLHAIGLGETNRQAASLLFDYSRETEVFTDLDRLMAWLFYHPRMRVGIDEATATGVASQILNELSDNGMIARR